MVKDGVVFTPVRNGSFLADITRARVITLLRMAGVPVAETTPSYVDFQAADEIFSSGNYTKISADRLHRRPEFAAGTGLSPGA